MIGLSTARELHMRGVRRTTVIDRGRVGGEASWAAAGMLAPNAECDSADEFHRFCVESAAMYPAVAEDLKDETGIDIELDRSGTLYLAFTEEDSHELSERYAWQNTAGMNVRRLSAEETLSLEPSVSRDVREALSFPDDWQVENRRLIEALRKYCVDHGIELLEEIEVGELLVENGKVAGVDSSAGRLFAGNTILAAGAWTSLVNVNGIAIPFQVKPIRGQMLCYKAESIRLRHVIYSSNGYLVPRADGRILAGSTVEDVGFQKDVTDAGIAQLRSVAAEIAPSLTAVIPIDKWAGLRPFVPPDGLPMIGWQPGVENLFIATGHYRNGILLAPITAKIVAEAIADAKYSEYLNQFSPERFLGARYTVGT